MPDQNSPRQRPLTKIVATVGPACREESQLETLVEAGVNVFRLNMAHAEPAEHEVTLHRIRAVAARRNEAIGVLIDLAGPKIRLGELPGGQLDCTLGVSLRFVRGKESSAADELVTNYDRLIDELKVGDRVMLADGTVSLAVEERGRDFARCCVTQAGLIRSRQGVNLPGVKVSLPAMSEVDRKHAVWAAEKGIDFVSLSFVRAANEVRELKALLRAFGSSARVIAKIEKQEALDRLEEVVEATDGVMVARGDLGVEIDVARMPMVQKKIVSVCNRYQKPVIIATQMLDSMQHSRRPTRAETTDVANAILDGCDACMLSGETAVGDYPRDAVEIMRRIALATETMYHDRPALPPADTLPEGLEEITQCVVYGAGHVARELNAKVIVVMTHSGVTALALSKRRSAMPTIGVSDNEAAQRQMALYWGVIPLVGAPARDSNELLQFASLWCQREGILAVGDRIVLVAGNIHVAQGHNMLMVHEVGRE